MRPDHLAATSLREAKLPENRQQMAINRPYLRRMMDVILPYSRIARPARDAARVS
jgi:hypothetical protein